MELVCVCVCEYSFVSLSPSTDPDTEDQSGSNRFNMNSVSRADLRSALRFLPLTQQFFLFTVHINKT